MRFVLLVLAISLALFSRLATAADPSPTAKAKSPNIVFLLADDLGWSDLGCYGSPFNETPHIDRLARQGVRFTQAYTAGAVCSPTRASLMTGRYPVRTDVTDYIPGLNPTGRRLNPPPTARQLKLEETTLGEAFQQAGYQTFYGGKWHLGGRGFEPPEQGFDLYVGDAQLGRHGRDPLVGKRISEAAIRFIDQRDTKRPFLAYLSYHEPHIPILEYPDHIEKFEQKAAKLPQQEGPAVIPERNGLLRIVQNNPAYGSEVAGLDSWVGLVLDHLEKAGLAENTIVVFFSDNGGLSIKDQPGPTSNIPLRAGKGWLYEGGIRVPLIVRAPGVTAAGTQSDAVVVSTDVFPTLLALAGLPLQPRHHLDGQSFLSALQAAATADPRTLFWHYPHYHGSTWAPGAAIRSGDFKLIEFFDEDTVELYDLSQDLGEQQNLADKQPEKVKTLRAELAAWRKEVGASVPPVEAP